MRRAFLAAAILAAFNVLPAQAAESQIVFQIDNGDAVLRHGSMIRNVSATFEITEPGLYRFELWHSRVNGWQCRLRWGYDAPFIYNIIRAPGGGRNVALEQRVLDAGTHSVIIESKCRWELIVLKV